jgi:hypothetical protein
LTEIIGLNAPTTYRACRVVMALWALSILHAENGALEIRDGYFWDPGRAAPFIPRGFACQTWNPPVGADQTMEQLRYDFLEFKKMHCNSVRCEMVWNQVELAAGVFDWSKPDELVRIAEELELKLFVLIGFQYAPEWFPQDWLAVNSQGGRSVVLNYEHPGARQVYSNYVAKVTVQPTKCHALRRA